jgi:predicted nucleic acid-binding protein
MKHLVADTGPLLHLQEAGALDLLGLVGKVSITRVILDELRLHITDIWQDGLPEWIRIADLSEDASRRANIWIHEEKLHLGEAQVLALARETRADWFLTDDAAARRIAEDIGMETRGSIGVILWAAAHRMIEKSRAEACFTGLENSSLWMSQKVRSEARIALARLFQS